MNDRPCAAKRRAWPRWLVRALLVLGALAAGLMLWWLYSLDVHTRRSFILPCMNRLMLGVYCPGCGMSRALNALLHGAFYQALRYNPFVYVMVPLGAYLGADVFLRLWMGRRVLPRLPVSWKGWAALGVLLVLFGVARNLPWSPFTSWVPTYVLG
nr:DUF2752 domain-containing protein [Maliibacterium massiliense]